MFFTAFYAHSNTIRTSCSCYFSFSPPMSVSSEVNVPSFGVVPASFPARGRNGCVSLQIKLRKKSAHSSKERRGFSAALRHQIKAPFLCEKDARTTPVTARLQRLRVQTTAAILFKTSKENRLLSGKGSSKMERQTFCFKSNFPQLPYLPPIIPPSAPPQSGSTGMPPKDLNKVF